MTNKEIQDIVSQLKYRVNREVQYDKECIDDGWYEDYVYCPMCKGELDDKKQPAYCPNCGQALDWRIEND